ncbi:MAG: hypothetical protein U9N84_07390, partial [Actinomycetota bacterium]|nr:hypothetical protein [Actinomycetota bacterium]
VVEEEVIWRTSALGCIKPAEEFPEAATVHVPGWRALLEYDGNLYWYHAETQPPWNDVFLCEVPNPDDPYQVVAAIAPSTSTVRL